MPAFDVLDALVRGGNGVLRTADAVAAGITKPVLGNYVRERDLERVGHGLYLAPDAWKDGMYLLHLRCPQAVFSHDTALFLHDLTDRAPLYKVDGTLLCNTSKKDWWLREKEFLGVVSPYIETL